MKTYLSPEDVELMEQAAPCTRDKLLIRLLFRLGCRVSEALGLRLGDIDFERRTVTIQHLKRRTELSCPKCGARLAKIHRFCPGCGQEVYNTRMQELGYRRMRTLPIDEDTLEMLTDFTRGDKLVPHDSFAPIFGMNRHRAWQVIRYCVQKAGLPNLMNPETGRSRGVSPHRLRDAFAVHAVKLDGSGDGLRLLQEHLGHASFNTTARYRKVAGDEHRRWYDRLWQNEEN